MGPVWSGVACDRFTTNPDTAIGLCQITYPPPRFLAESLPERSIDTFFYGESWR